jgi:hypothetical protein
MVFDFNKDEKRRDTIIFGDYHPEVAPINYQNFKFGPGHTGGIRRFNNMSPATLQQLVEEGFADPQECQNEGPSIYVMLQFAEKHPEWQLTFEGYAVSKDRDDYRVTVDGITAHGDVCLDGGGAPSWKALIRHHSEYDFRPTEYGGIRVWWD